MLGYVFETPEQEFLNVTRRALSRACFSPMHVHALLVMDKPSCGFRCWPNTAIPACVLEDVVAHD